MHELYRKVTAQGGVIAVTADNKWPVSSSTWPMPTAELHDAVTPVAHINGSNIVCDITYHHVDSL